MILATKKRKRRKKEFFCFYLEILSFYFLLVENFDNLPALKSASAGRLMFYSHFVDEISRCGRSSLFDVREN